MEGQKQTPLFDLHRQLGARMVDFHGWTLPVHYREGVLKEHSWCREQAGLFDVSHMTQTEVSGTGCAQALEQVLAIDLCGLAVGQARYGLMTNEQGGIIDDLIATRTECGFLIVSNAATCMPVLKVLRSTEQTGLVINQLTDQALIALQGPKAAAVLQAMAPQVNNMRFMTSIEASVSGIPCRLSRLGYTGEDGFEVSIQANYVNQLASDLLSCEPVTPIGLGARDSLRLEAGLCLYGQDIDKDTTPVEAGLAWTIGKERRLRGGFAGDRRISAQIANGSERLRVGLLPEGRAPVRGGTDVLSREGKVIGRITSGGYSPSLQRPIAMAYVPQTFAKAGTLVEVNLRGKSIPCSVTKLPFVPHRYAR